MSRRRAVALRSGCAPLRGSGRGPMSRRRAAAAALAAAAVIPLLVAAAPARAQAASPCASEMVVPAGQAGLRADCEALWDFYTRLDDPGDLDDPGPGAWGPGTPLSSWRGVEISPLSGRVNALYLFALGLSGPVSPELGKLTELLSLNLSSNRLSGPIPAELGRLGDLVILNLSRNRLSGPIPAELGRLAGLTQMSLYESGLTGPLPPELGRLSNLVEFEYHGNRFSGPWPSTLRRFNPYLSDPLGLIADLPTHRRHSLTNETWDVWFCDTPAGDVALDDDVILPLFNDRLTPYFRWLSDGRYQPRFRLAGPVAGADMFGCSDKAAAEAADSGSGNRRLIVADEDNGLGVFWGTSVLVAASASSLRPTGPDGLDPETGLDLRSQWLYFVAHEMGHAVGFPHSYGGNVLVSVGFEHRGETLLPEGTVSEYDNPMDVMSNLGKLGGTVAVNRYAAGWIDPANVAVHSGGAVRTYELRAPGLGGTQMLVLPSGDFGIFTMLGARVATGYDSTIPKEGVEVYRVTHRVNEWRNQPFPPAEKGSTHLDWTRHVHPAGEKFEAGGAAVEVLSRSGGRFTVRVGPGRGSPPPSPEPEPEPEPAHDGRFSDDDDSAHEANIEVIAARGITVGCDPARPDRFCPARPVTRAQMMAFLGRALGPSAAGAATVPIPRFSDVPADAWYRPHLERLAALGAVEPYADGTFRPSEPLIRRDMAVLLARTFPDISPVAKPTGVFTDVPADAPGAAEVEGVLAAGVTRGCSARPMRYCPGDSVTRAQMASFLARALRADRPVAGSAPKGSAGSS